MLTFLAALCQKCANHPSLKLSVSVIIDDVETVSADLRRASVGYMKKNNNCVNPLNISAHAHLLCNFTPEMGVLPLFEVVCLRNY